jgi:beta-glucosidase
MRWGALSTVLAQVVAQNVYDLAVKCANDILAANPKLPSQWIYENRTFGGRETENFVGWVDHTGTMLPDINMMDGPQGVRDILNGAKYKNRTSWPAASIYGLAWSPEFAFYGGVMAANDWRAVGANTALTPGANIHRVPTNGRNWEYVSGEDALLGTLAGQFVSGLQSQGLMGSLKHYALNNQELNREGVVVRIDEETVMHTYLRAFQPAIDAGTGSVMCSYNQVQFDDDSFAYTCGSSVLSNDLLRETMGFKGALMTDWGAKMINTTRGVASLQRQIVSWEMVWGSNIKALVQPVDMPSIVQTSLVGLLASGILTMPEIPSCKVPGVKVPSNPPSIAALPSAYQQAFKNGDVAEFSASLVAEAMVLLKNTFLPLSGEVKVKIVLVGTALLNGGGSGDSAAFGWDTPNHLGEGLHNGGRMAQELMASTLANATGHPVVWDYQVPGYDPSKYSLIIVFGGQFRSEAYLVDQKDGFYDIDQCNSGKNESTYGKCNFNGLLQNFQKARQSGSKVLAVTTTGGVHYPAYMSMVDAALTLMYPGQHFAQALAKVLVGDISPGGRLTYTLPTLEADGKTIQSPVGRFNSGLKFDGSTRNTLNAPAFLWNVTSQSPSKLAQYDYNISYYAEKNLVGYKYYQKYGMVPMFPFGFGLSYANYSLTADFSQCTAPSTCSITVKVSSSYTKIASTVIQVYIGFVPSSEDPLRPLRELRAFRKVWAAGSQVFDLGSNDFASDWDSQTRRWVSPCVQDPKGKFEVYVGSNSEDLKLTIALGC